MMTVRQMQRLWDTRQFKRLVEEISSQRIEALAADELTDHPAVAAAAWGLIRLEELNQPQVPLCRILINVLVARQESDGGWGDVAVTALVLRGMHYLAQLQQPDGIWPKIPIRRLCADAVVSAFVMLQLAENPRFRAAVDFSAAVNWFHLHVSETDAAAQTIWTHARPRAPLQSQGRLFQPSN
jgi:hypothetical protein